MEKLLNEYERAIESHQQIINANRMRLKISTDNRNRKETVRLNQLLKLLYEEKWEMEEAAIGIRDYLRRSS